VDTEQVSPSQLPARSLYEYCFDINDGCWRSWRSYVSQYVPPADGQFSKILVPTADVIRTTWLVKTVAGAGHPCLLVGESGTAKTVTITKFLDGLDPTSMLSRALYFSSRTSSADVQLAIEDATEKRTKVRGSS
jgi:dynein heavy chain